MTSGSVQMECKEPIAVVEQFVEFINQQNLEGLANLTAKRYRFVDVNGLVYKFSGPESVKRSWEEYFSAHPDYRIHVDQILLGGCGVAVFGRTTGSHFPTEVEAGQTLLWVAQVKGGLVEEWRIYAGTED
jgi:hypothetical protein